MGSVGIHSTGNPVHLPSSNPYPICALTNLNFRCHVFQVAQIMIVYVYGHGGELIWKFLEISGGCMRFHVDSSKTVFYYSIKISITHTYTNTTHTHFPGVPLPGSLPLPYLAMATLVAITGALCLTQYCTRRRRRRRRRRKS